MASEYRKQDWKGYRAEIIELDGGACRRCGRTPENVGVVLQVHHKRYVQGMKAWDYPPSDCETLCKGCHAELHGHIAPSHGWQYVGEDDLGSLDGSCELCGTAIRYEFYIVHDRWGTRTVGTDCCDRLTGTAEATAYIDLIGRKKRFVSSTRWKAQGDSSLIRQSGFEVKIAPSRAGYRVHMNGRAGNKESATLEAAKKLAFDALASGAVHRYFERLKTEHRRASVTVENRLGI